MDPMESLEAERGISLVQCVVSKVKNRLLLKVLVVADPLIK